jgi:glycosyltransferase involved in cell wall biosynthesis
MWAKNGEALLPTVLQRIDQVIPAENVCHKILVDDHSIDRTADIARDFNWDVYTNPTGGIPSGANEALRHVDREFFVSIEQDIILSQKWWETIPKHMDNPLIACAQGIRIPTRPVLRILEERQQGPPQKREYMSMISIDNNIFRTKIIKAVGGFPKDCPICTDRALMGRIQTEMSYRWIIDPNIVSLHFRNDLEAFVEHAYKLTYMCAKAKYCDPPEPDPISSVLRVLLTSPLRATQIAFEEKCPDAIWVYPLIRLYQLTIALNYRKVLFQRSHTTN